VGVQGVYQDSVHRQEAVHCHDSIHRQEAVHCHDSIHRQEAVHCHDSIHRQQVIQEAGHRQGAGHRQQVVYGVHRPWNKLGAQRINKVTFFWLHSIYLLCTNMMGGA
jgi:hypothetical protein